MPINIPNTMVEEGKDNTNRPTWPLSEENRSYLESEILKLSSEETPQIKSANPKEVRSLIDKAIEIITKLEEVAKNRHKSIRPDTDVVWVLSAPGSYSSDFQEPGWVVRQGDKHKAQYLVSPWVKGMYRHRVRTGIALVHEITAKRIGKPVHEITQEDIRRNGPWFVYNPQPEEVEQIESVIADPVHKIPPEKVFIFSSVIQEDGSEYPIYNTIDQIKGLRFPIHPRRVAVVSHAPHLARVFFALDYFNDRIPKDTTIQAFPIKTPSGGELKYPEMEIRGILGNVYKYNASGKKSVDFEI